MRSVGWETMQAPPFGATSLTVIVRPNPDPTSSGAASVGSRLFFRIGFSDILSVRANTEVMMMILKSQELYWSV